MAAAADMRRRSYLFLLAKSRQQMKTMVSPQLPLFRSVLVGASWPDRGRGAVVTRRGTHCCSR